MSKPTEEVNKQPSFILGTMSPIAILKKKFPLLGNKRLLLPILLGFTLLLIVTASRFCLLESGTSFVKVSEFEETSPSTFNNACSLSVDYKRRLAASIADVQREIHRLAGKTTIIDSRWSIKLAAVARELDPRMTVAARSSWDFSARLPDMGPALQLPNRKRHVCPEVYHGPKYGAPFGQHGMEPENCSYAPDFSTVLTAVLPATTWKASDVNFVVEQIRKHYDIPIYVIASSFMDINDNISNLTVRKVRDDYDEGSYINEAVRTITTPYVFFGISLAHFSNQSSLERLVRVLDELKHVKIAGGAARDHQGHWIHGCVQQRMANYQATYNIGYYYSKYECMYCDDLLTPFVTTTELLRDRELTKGLSGPALYRDWFSYVQESGYLTVACPDVMFFVTNHTTMNESDWLKVAKEWSLEKIHSFDGKYYNFSCDLVRISCNNPLGIIRSFILPPCCRALMEKYLGYLTDYGKEHNLPYELQAGSALGAIKMGGYLPWDYDTDLVFECKDYAAWLEINKVLKPKGCHATVNQKNKYITVHCPKFFLELYCHRYNVTSHQYLPVEYQGIPTTITYSGKDVVVSSNPGLHARNRIGLENLKHAAHWRTLKVSKIGKAKGGYDNPGLWNPCTKPSHHSCLDRYPGDGNIPFLQPFLYT